MASMNKAEAEKCKSRAEVETLTLCAYYQKSEASAYNLDEALDTLVTFTERDQITVHLEQQKCYTELSRKPIVVIYTSIPDHPVPKRSKARGYSPLCKPSGRTLSREEGSLIQ